MVDLSVRHLGLTKRSLPRSRADDAEQALGRFVRADSWNGMSAGDVVRVAGHSARGRHWRFRAYVTNTSNGASWVEVSLVEGPPPSRRPSATAALAAGALAASGESDSREMAGEAPRVERVRSFAPELITPRWRRRLRSQRRASQEDRASQCDPVAQQSLF